MTTNLEEPKIHENADEKPRCDPTCLLASVQDAVEQIEKSFNTSKDAILESLEEGKRSVQRLLKHGRIAIEDGFEEGTHQIKRNPLAYVAAAFALGTISGLMAGVLLRRASKT